MKRLYPSIFLAAIVISAIAATIKISDLPISTSPSTNTFIEIADMNAVTKSSKYLLTNLVTVAQGQASTNALTNTFVLKAGDSMSGALTGPSATFTNGITAGASTFTNASSSSVALGVDAFNGMTNTPFYVKRGGSNLVDIGQHPILTGGLEALRVYHNGPNNASNFLFFIDLGDPSGIAGARAAIPVSVLRIEHAGSLNANVVWDQTNKRFNIFDTNYVAGWYEVGQEGLTLHASPPGSTNTATDFFEILQVRPNGVDLNGSTSRPTTGYWNQFKSSIYMETIPGNNEWRTSAQVPVWIRSQGDDANKEVMRLEQAFADSTGQLIYFKKARGTLSSRTIVNSGDAPGGFFFQGWNGTSYDTAASWFAIIDGTPGASGDMPGAFIFRTSPDGSATPVQRMKIAQDGAVTVGNTVNATNGFAVGAVAGITTTWTNIISGVITQRISTIGGLVVTNLTL